MNLKSFWKVLEILFVSYCIIFATYDYMAGNMSWFEHITIMLLTFIVCKVSQLLERNQSKNKKHLNHEHQRMPQTF